MTTEFVVRLSLAWLDSSPVRERTLGKLLDIAEHYSRTYALRFEDVRPHAEAAYRNLPSWKKPEVGHA